MREQAEAKNLKARNRERQRRRGPEGALKARVTYCGLKDRSFVLLALAGAVMEAEGDGRGKEREKSESEEE